MTHPCFITSPLILTGPNVIHDEPDDDDDDHDANRRLVETIHDV